LENRKIKLLIIDDSVLFRSQIQLALKDVPEIEIVGSASNGRVAIEKMKELSIDICTLDVEMPILDGIGTLKEMRDLGIKTKALMFSSLTVSGAEKTLEAMSLGAVDFVTKPVVDDTQISPTHKIREALLPKILGLSNPLDKKTPKTLLNSDRPRFMWDLFFPEILVIASSTGGPNALVEFFSLMKDPLPFPILITQHMPPLFTASLAERLGFYSGKISSEAVDGEILRPNQIYVAPGNYHMRVAGDKKNPTVHLDKGPMRNYVRPCADFLFESASQLYGKNTLGIVLTGMGRDGFEGAMAIKEKRGAVLIQNEESCVVFGMPGVVFEGGYFDYTGTPQDLAFKTLAVARVRRTSNAS
jgi:two-component system chemotaxis response regulator CheB